MEELGIALKILEGRADRGMGDLEIFALAKTVVARGLTLENAQSMEVRGDRPSGVKRLLRSSAISSKAKSRSGLIQASTIRIFLNRCEQRLALS